MLKFDNINVVEAKTFKERLIGLMFKKDINYGLLFNNCRSIHTFFMKEEIDIVLADKDDTIIKTYKCFKPNKILIGPSNTKRIYELPKNTL